MSMQKYLEYINIISNIADFISKLWKKNGGKDVPFFIIAYWSKKSGTQEHEHLTLRTARLGVPAQKNNL